MTIHINDAIDKYHLVMNRSERFLSWTNNHCNMVYDHKCDEYNEFRTGYFLI